jgi:hypothetical protein
MTVASRAAVGDASAPITAFTLVLNYLPFVQLVTGATLVGLWARSWGSALLGTMAWLYLVPPIVCRLTFLAWGRPHGRGLTQKTRPYKVWWFTHQWQIVFNRLPWLEELLRLVPGLYAFWIGLWGGRVSPFAYWGPGSVIVDRGLVVVQPRAVIGMGAGLTGHLGRLAPDGTYCVDVAAPNVGRGAIMGARSGLGPGAQLLANQMLPAGRLIPPFVQWDGASKRRLPETGEGIRV